MTDETDALLAAASAVPADADLGTVRDLALAFVRASREAERLELALKEAKERARDLAERQLPERLQAVGLAAFKLPGGAELELKPFAACTIPEEKRERAFAWLTELGVADLIKHEVVASYGRGEDEMARALYEQLKAAGRPVEDRKTVHYQTLNAFVRRRLEEGKPLDPNALDVYAGTHAKLKLPKGVTLQEILDGGKRTS